MTYRGRFAPTPSGPLHFGSVVAALGSWLDARAHGGEWHLRIDDLDPPRLVAGAADSIVRTLERLGLTWDGPIVHQSERTEAYADAVSRLARRAHVYRCTCTRRKILEAGLPGNEGPRYPGTCRERPDIYPGPGVWRIDVRDVVVAFEDLLQGPVTQALETAVGDFVLRRSDGIHGYHLACVVDDAASGVTLVVRGADLRASTPVQRLLQALLDFPEPAYLHHPLLVHDDGRRLAKRDKAPTLAALRDNGLDGRALAKALAAGRIPSGFRLAQA